MSESTPEPQTEERPTEPTFRRSDPTPPAPAPGPEDEALKAYAPSFAAVSSFMGQPGLFVQWKPPTEGKATSYTITASNGAETTVGGDVTQIELLGLTPGEEVSVTITAKVGSKGSGSLTTAALLINDYIDLGV